MFNGKTATVILTVTLIVVSTGFAQTLDENWNDFLHYIKIGRFDLAKGYAQTILDSNPDPVELLELSKSNAQGYAILLRVNEMAPDAELAELSGKIIELIEKGSYERRSDPMVIVAEIKRLSSTERGWFTAVRRLRNAGEYAIPFMLNALADNSRQAEFPDIVRAIPQIGRDAIRPLVAALQMKNVAIKDQIITALAKIGYPQSVPYLKYIVENDSSSQIRELAKNALAEIDPGTLKISAAQLFFQLAEKYYYHLQSLAPAEDADFANIWFWDANQQQLNRVEVPKAYFYELMSMRCCEWALKSDAGFGPAIGLWLAAFFKAESAGMETMPSYFGQSHADALVYATTAGVEYLHQALARAIKDKNAYVALGVIEALGTTAGDKSLLYRIGPAQPLLEALSFNNINVRYSAAIAIASAGPMEPFAESKLVVANLAEALGQTSQPAAGQNIQWNKEIADSYALRSAQAMLHLAITRNPVINLSAAQNALVSAINDQRKEIQILSGQILAHLDSPGAQRAIAAMALDNNNDLDVRIEAFNSLTTSAKLNANMLVDAMVDAIYSLISSDQTNPEIRSAAAAAYGALNLPSQKVKDLILDQAKS
jgi:HEAT repeat protein